MQSENQPANVPEAPTSHRENLWLNLGFNLLIPILLLSKGTDILGLPPKINLLVALAFPLGYGLYDAFTKKKFNFLSALGFASVFIKGSIGLFELNKDWVAINEAALPLIIGLAVLITLKTKNPLVKVFLFNPQVFHVGKIEQNLEERGTRPAFNKLLRRCTAWLAASFLLSAILNYLVAKIFIKTEPTANLEQFNRELGAMQGWSYLIIMVPSMVVTAYALYILVQGIQKLTGLSFEEALNQPDPKKK